MLLMGSLQRRAVPPIAAGHYVIMLASCTAYMHLVNV